MAARRIGLRTAAILSPRLDGAILGDDVTAGQLVIPDAELPELVTSLLGGAVALQLLTIGLVHARGTNPDLLRREQAPFELDGQLGETQQQVAMARIRAIESDRAMVYASTTGQSAIISPDGSLIASSGTWRRAELDARVPLRANLTLADRLGGWPEGAISAATAAALAWALASAPLARNRSRRERRPPAR